jgi:formylglycine-generating enzyme required for sulfatase activity
LEIRLVAIVRAEGRQTHPVPDKSWTLAKQFFRAFQQAGTYRMPTPRNH